MLQTEKLGKTEKEFLSFAVNQFGDGQHPVISEMNQKFLGKEYARSCVLKALKSGKMSEVGVTAAQTLLETLA